MLLRPKLIQPFQILQPGGETNTENTKDFRPAMVKVEAEPAPVASPKAVSPAPESAPVSLESPVSPESPAPVAANSVNLPPTGPGLLTPPVRR